MADSDRVFGRVLSVQSHTVHGYVGNKSAVFPLQLLGFDVDPINSVQFSNHTGYKNGFKGEVLDGTQLWSIVQGLNANQLLKGYSHMLTGYIGSVTFLRTILKVVDTLKQHNPGLVYFCDPVLGDNGKLYVAPELVDIYRAEVVPVATVLTPNQFECELLTGVSIKTPSDAHRACAVLHRNGVKTAIITSVRFPETPDVVSLFASTCLEKTDKAINTSIHRVDIPLIPGHYTGTGDLIAALLLAWTTRHPEDLALALRKACASVYSLIQRTHRAVEDGSNPNGELDLIRGRFDILNAKQGTLTVHTTTEHVQLQPSPTP